ncbi:helix-turn-helix domain-containing protein [Providencia sp. PROV129]|uniref:helix-turn-helix domain-containing protein n=1 Tax=Providencia sp. PROV129 TaxID=2949839 RepID=UPI00234AE358|nr:helix-turn-helix transcriptional regulator [Providencia sp. PROV129]
MMSEITLVLHDKIAIKKIIAKNVGVKIKKIRKNSKVSGLNLAKFIGISQQQLSKYENGHSDIPISKIMLIALYFSVDVNYFFTK